MADPVDSLVGPSESEFARWREELRRDPDWGARQLWGLLRRAIDAERDGVRQCLRLICERTLRAHFELENLHGPIAALDRGDAFMLEHLDLLVESVRKELGL